MTQLNDHNNEELDGVYTRPTLDLYLCNKYWNFLTKDLSKEELQDLENARNQLQHYEKLYSLMEYGSDLNGILTTLDTRVSSTNPSIPMTIYRQVGSCLIILSNLYSLRTTRPRRFSRRWSFASRPTTA